MKTLKPFLQLFLLAGWLVMAGSACAQTTAFTYQGRLTDASQPATSS